MVEVRIVAVVSVHGVKGLIGLHPFVFFVLLGVGRYFFQSRDRQVFVFATIVVGLQALGVVGATFQTATMRLEAFLQVGGASYVNFPRGFKAQSIDYSRYLHTVSAFVAL
jgi:hypothetical protein